MQKEHLTKSNTLLWLKKKTLNKPEIEVNFLNKIKAMYVKLRAQGWKAESFFPKIGNKTRMPTFATS